MLRYMKYVKLGRTANINLAQFVVLRLIEYLVDNARTIIPVLAVQQKLLDNDFYKKWSKL